MWVAPAIAVTSAMLLASTNPGALLVAAPLFAAVVAVTGGDWLVDQPSAEAPRGNPGAEQRRFLHSPRAPHLGIFDHFVDADNNWLPPRQLPGVSHRLGGAPDPRRPIWDWPCWQT